MKFLKKNNDVVKEVRKSASKNQVAAPIAKKSATTGESISGWIFKPVLSSLLVLGVGYAVLELFFVQPAVQDNRQFTKDIVSSAYAQSIESHITDRKQLISNLAQSDGIESTLTNPKDRDRIRRTIVDSHKDIEQIYFVAADQIDSARSDYPELSFASIDLLRRALAGEKVQLESFLQDKSWVYQLAHAVSIQQEGSDAGRNAGVVLAVFNTSALTRLLAGSGAIPEGEIALLSTAGASNRAIINRGAGDADESVTVSLSSGDWALRYAPQSDRLPDLERMPLWLIYASVTLLVVLFVWLFSRLAMQSLRSELIKAAQTLRAVIAGEGKKARDIKVAEVISMLSVAEQSMEKLAEKQIQAPVEKTAQAKPAGSSSESDDPLFDDDLLELDELAGADDEYEMGSTAHTDDEGEPMVQEVEQLDLDVPQSIFRAYDIRGVVDETLNEGIVELIGKALASEALAQGQSTLCVGYDGRLSSVDYCEAITRGIVSTGANAIIVGQVPTPVLYFATHQLETGSGVMITGSHNPSNYNGFKMMIAGNTLSGEDIQKLYNRIILQDFESGQGARSEQPVDRDYLDTILNDIAVAAPLKVVVDAGNGVAGELAPALIEELGCEVIPLHCEIDGTFPNHHPDPGKPENLQDLIAAVQEHDADIGLAFDGDGDRVGVVTNSGKITWPDRLLMLFAKDVVSRNPGADIIFDVKCSRRLNGLITSYGGRPIMWKTGHSLIKSKMKETGALLAGEMSGHIFFKERWFGFDDGLYSAARLLEILGIDDRNSDDVFASFPEDISTPEINITVTDENKFAIVDKLCAVKDQFKDGNVSTIDGLRVDFENGWGLCRASNTTPMLVLRFEADDESALEEIKSKFKEQLAAVEPGLDVDF